MELESIIEVWCHTRKRDDVIALLEAADIPTGAINDVPSVVAHAQLAARGRWTHASSPGGDIRALIPPHNLKSVTPRMGRVPSLGEHTTEVLTELRST
jgi:formyl-CoA transferase